MKECNRLIRYKHLYGTRKKLVSEKEEIKCNNIIKQYKNWLTLMNIIQIGQKFLIIYTEY